MHAKLRASRRKRRRQTHRANVRWARGVGRVDTGQTHARPFRLCVKVGSKCGFCLRHRLHLLDWLGWQIHRLHRQHRLRRRHNPISVNSCYLGNGGAVVQVHKGARVSGRTKPKARAVAHVNAQMPKLAVAMAIARAGLSTELDLKPSPANGHQAQKPGVVVVERNQRQVLFVNNEKMVAARAANGEGEKVGLVGTIDDAGVERHFWVEVCSSYRASGCPIWKYDQLVLRKGAARPELCVGVSITRTGHKNRKMTKNGNKQKERKITQTPPNNHSLYGTYKSEIFQFF